MRGCLSVWERSLCTNNVNDDAFYLKGLGGWTSFASKLRSYEGHVMHEMFWYDTNP